MNWSYSMGLMTGITLISTIILIEMGIFDPGWVKFLLLGSGLPSLVWVCIWKISPKNVKFFNFLPFGSKKCHWVGSKRTPFRAMSASYLLRVKSMFGSGQGPSLHFEPFLLLLQI